jgi:hypothetical protein
MKRSYLVPALIAVLVHAGLLSAGRSAPARPVLEHPTSAPPRHPWPDPSVASGPEDVFGGG